MNSPIRPLHFSVRNPITPNNMEKMRCSHEQRAFLERTALEIFTDVVNAGHTFQKALAAIYLSGMQHAVSCESESQK